MKKKKTQIEKLLTNFVAGKTVSNKQAIAKNILRLSARIYDLRNKFGLDIATVKEKRNSKTQAKYKLVETKTNISAAKTALSSF